MLIILCKRKTKFINKQTCCLQYFPPPGPLERAGYCWVWHEHFRFSCAYMDAYISPPSKKINLGYHTHLSIKAHCGNQSLRESPEIAGFLIFTPCEPPPMFYHRWSEECSKSDGVTPEMSMKKTEASTLNFLLVSLRESQMLCFRDTQPVEGSTRSVSEAG